MTERVKVQVNKIVAFIPVKEYLKLYDNPTTVFHGHSLDIPMTFKQKISKDEIEIRLLEGENLELYVYGEKVYIENLSKIIKIPTK